MYNLRQDDIEELMHAWLEFEDAPAYLSGIHLAPGEKMCVVLPVILTGKTPLGR